MASGKINKIQRPQLLIESKSATGLPKSFATSVSNYIEVPSITKSGYTPLGVVQWSGSGTTWFQWCDMYIDGTTLKVYFFNNTGAAHTLNSFTAKILYWKIN